MSVDPIITDLMFVMETSQELDILNFYKSFPITCRARVESIERDTVTMKVQPPGSAILEGQTQTIVLSRGLPEAVRANVLSFDLVTGTLKLNDFNYVGSHFGERMIARVQPEETIPVEVESDGVRYEGTMVDVSLSGVGIFLPRPLQKGEMVQLTLPLPEGKVNMPGKVLNVSEAPDAQSRLAIGFTRNAQEISVIMRYIRDRRKEILEEVERIYNEAFRDAQQKA
jgi:hypothetical protein